MKIFTLFCIAFLVPVCSFSQQDYREFGDAPEGAIAYPSTGIIGLFPTCMTVGPNGFVIHNNFGAFFVGFDLEVDGNAGLCPMFAPYDNDECFGDGDAGLMFPEPYTIISNIVTPCPGFNGTSMGATCQSMIWGNNVDINVTNFMPNQAMGFVNVIVDWNQNGNWGDILVCPAGACPEHVLVNHPVMNGYSGPLSLTGPPPFLSGPNPGFYWARFTISEMPVQVNWNGEGNFEDGESEDYLIYIGDFDYGDAPEGAIAYPASGTIGQYPTCVSAGAVGSYIQHALGASWFGPMVDLENEGNQGVCPVFTPNAYDKDECFQDNDAGLLMPAAYTITGAAGQEMVAPCTGNAYPLDTVCKMANWGSEIDIQVTGTGYVNLLIDWNQDGQWALDTTQKCNGTVVPEHVLVDFPVTAAAGAPLSSFSPPAFLVGPDDGFVWARFSITPVMTGPNWSGAGTFTDGETEDYLFEIATDFSSINLIDPEVITPLRVIPNPVKEKMTIEFSLYEQGPVSIDLLDPQGRILANLVNEFMSKGSHQVTVDPDMILNKTSSGFFFVRLTAKGKPAAYSKVVIVR